MGKIITNFARVAAIAGLLAANLALMPGCSSRQETRTTVTHSYSPVESGSMENAPGYSPDQPENDTTTTTTTTTTTNRPDSVLGATAHAVWTVVALPFRIVGDTLSLIL